MEDTNMANNKLHITDKHNGKMEGMQSLSTCALCNPNCNKNRNIDGSICKRCYACTMEKRFSNMTKSLINNGEILSSRILDASELPRINASFFRFEAFGDLINANQLVNYINICKKNPFTRFALWTKHFMVADEVFCKMGIEKPQNLQMVASSLMINQPIKRPTWADTTFTVWSNTEEAEKNGAKINCGKKKCIDCLSCYIGSCHEVNELLK